MKVYACLEAGYKKELEYTLVEAFKKLLCIDHILSYGRKGRAPLRLPQIQALFGFTKNGEKRKEKKRKTLSCHLPHAELHGFARLALWPGQKQQQQQQQQ